MSTIQIPTEMSDETLLQVIEINHKNKMYGSYVQRNTVAELAQKHKVKFCNDCLALQDIGSCKSCWRCKSVNLQ